MNNNDDASSANVEALVQALDREAAFARSIQPQLMAMTAEVRTRAVTVRVAGNGTVDRMTVHRAGLDMDPHALGATIAAATNKALANVQAKVTERLTDLDTARGRLTAELARQGNPIGKAAEQFAESVKLPAAAASTPDTPHRACSAIDFAGQPGTWLRR